MGRFESDSPRDAIACTVSTRLVNHQRIALRLFPVSSFISYLQWTSFKPERSSARKTHQVENAIHKLDDCSCRCYYRVTGSGSLNWSATAMNSWLGPLAPKLDRESNLSMESGFHGRLWRKRPNSAAMPMCL